MNHHTAVLFNGASSLSDFNGVEGVLLSASHVINGALSASQVFNGAALCLILWLAQLFLMGLCLLAQALF